MKIAVIGVKSIPAKHGRIKYQCQELYTSIAARGHKVDLYVEPDCSQQPWFSSYTDRNIKVIALLSLPGKQLNFLFNSALNTVWATFGKYDIIHIYGTTTAWFAWFARLFSGTRIIVTSQQLDGQKASRHRAFRWLLPTIEKIAIKSADRVIASSKALATYFNRKYSICPRYIPGAPTSYTSTHSDFNYGTALGLTKKRYILCIGNFEPDLGLDLLIEAFVKLQFNDWKLVIAGEISQSTQYAIDLLKMSKRQKNIIFINEIREFSLTQLVHNAGVFVSPSEATDLAVPLRMLEAMREGVPVLASDTVAHRESIDRDRGLLFKSGQVDSLIRQLEYAMSKPNLLRIKVKQAQMYITTNHNWDRVSYQHLYLYLQMTTKVQLESPIQKVGNQNLQ